MNNMKMLINMLIKGKNKLEINIQDRLPLDSLTIQINGVTHLVLVIGTFDYNRRVVVTDLKGNIIKEITKITKVEDEDIHLAKDNENIYITKSISSYSSVSKCSLQNLAIRARHEFPGTNFTDIIVDDLYIYVYDSDLSLLNVCYSNLKEDSVDGSVRLMSDNENKDERITYSRYKYKTR